MEYRGFYGVSMIQNNPRIDNYRRILGMPTIYVQYLLLTRDYLADRSQATDKAKAFLKKKKKVPFSNSEK